MITPELLQSAGECLHGAHWQVPLSRDMKVADRTMRRWAKDGAPDSIAPELVELLTLRGQKIIDVIPRLTNGKDA